MVHAAILQVCRQRGENSRDGPAAARVRRLLVRRDHCERVQAELRRETSAAEVEKPHPEQKVPQRADRVQEGEHRVLQHDSDLARGQPGVSAAARISEGRVEFHQSEQNKVFLKNNSPLLILALF